MSDTDRENSRNPSTYGFDFGALTGHQPTRVINSSKILKMSSVGVPVVCLSHVFWRNLATSRLMRTNRLLRLPLEFLSIVFGLTV